VRHFIEELEQLKTKLLEMSAIVESSIQRSISAVTQKDRNAAEEVFRTEARINEAQRHVSSLITTAIATQSPVARDLRFLLSLDHVSYELERMGDHAASVAKQGRKLAPMVPLKRYADLPRMGELAATQVRAVLHALVDLDERNARVVAAADDDIDDLYHSIFAEMIELMRSDPAMVEPGTRVLFAAHYLERIGDRVTNIAEDVVFLATGDVEDLNP